MQEVAYDDGVLAMQFAEHVARDAEPAFKQENIKHYRAKMVAELVQQKIDIPREL